MASYQGPGDLSDTFSPFPKVMSHIHNGDLDQPCTFSVLDAGHSTRSGEQFVECGQHIGLHIHSWVGRAADAGSNDVPCLLNYCRRTRLATVHVGVPIQFGEHSLMRNLDQEADAKGFEDMRVGPPSDYETRPALMAWDAYSAKVRALLEAKQQGYGDAWLMQGYMGNLARVLSKAARLENTMWHDDERDGIGATVGGDSLADTLLDLGPLSAFMLANFESGNRWGRGR